MQCCSRIRWMVPSACLNVEPIPSSFSRVGNNSTLWMWMAEVWRTLKLPRHCPIPQLYSSPPGTCVQMNMHLFLNLIIYITENNFDVVKCCLLFKMIWNLSSREEFTFKCCLFVVLLRKIWSMHILSSMLGHIISPHFTSLRTP